MPKAIEYAIASEFDTPEIGTVPILPNILNISVLLGAGLYVYINNVVLI
jgi:hypothetical protein